MLRGKMMWRALLGLGLVTLLGAQTCTGPVGRYPYDDVPPGSYLRSCEAARVVYGDRLVAQCPTGTGRVVETSLRLPCQGDIANEGGQLVCRALDGGGYDAVPSGSYQRSCRNERVARGDLLTAECQDRFGRYVEASLRLPCRDDIANADGRLVCGRGDDGYDSAPRGSYRESCENARVLRGDLLVAECRDRFGRYVETSLQLPCARDIANDEGRLVCGAPGYDTGYGQLPSGSYQQSCRDARVFGGDVLVAACRDRYGRYSETDLRLPCRGDIANEDGRLVCLAGGGWPQPGYPGTGGLGDLPRGGFVESCTSPRVRDGMLTANCPDRFGRFLFASLRLPCDGWVENVDGRLICRR